MRHGVAEEPALNALARTAAAVALLVALAGCRAGQDTGASPAAPLRGYNVVLVNIDSLRADHLGVYGYPRDTSPSIDRVAAEGVAFLRAVSNSSFTRESVASLMTGLLPTRGGSVGWAAAPSPERRTLAELFRDAGYRTASFSNTVMLGDPNFHRGFDEVARLPDRWGTSGLSRELSARAAEFAEGHADERFFLYLHYLDPHGPYAPSDEDRRRFAPEPVERPLRVYGGLRSEVTGLLREGFGPGDPRFEDLVARYDAEIADTDAAIGDLFASLRALGLAERTLVVITADHGEEFLEHDFVEHAWTLYQESLRIPLVFWAPGRLRAGRSDALVSTVDLLPTLVALLGIPGGPQETDGRVLFDARGRMGPEPAEANAFAELLIRERNVQRAVTRGEWKYIATYRWIPPEERAAAAAVEQELRERGHGSEPALWGAVVREELYRLSDDAGERRDLAARHPEKLVEMRDALSAYRELSEATGLAPGRGADPSELDAEARERLRALGYL